MNTSFQVINRQALEDFLNDLICELKRPEATDLLVDVLLTIQPPPNVLRSTPSPPIPIDRPASRKQRGSE
jgi:hypothetical protein